MDPGSAQSTNNSALAGYRESASGVGSPAGAPSSSGVFSSAGNAANGALDILNISNGLNRGGFSGYGGAALSAGKLYQTASGDKIPGLGAAGNVLGIYNGVKRGGVMGYGGAAINAGQLANNFGAGIPGLGPAAAALGTYDAIKGYQSGATGHDALAGAEAGAEWGSLVGPEGALIGAAIGGTVGAVASIFGPGREDAENVGWNQYAQAYDKSGAAGVAGATPSQNFQALTGIFDSRGSSIPFYGKYGRQGENQFTSDMMKQVNSAISSGKVAPGATPQQIYAKVVEPWINSMSPGGWQNSYTVQGASEKGAVGNVLTSLIGQWQNGQISNSTQLGIGGQTLQGGVPTYGA